MAVVYTTDSSFAFQVIPLRHPFFLSVRPLPRGLCGVLSQISRCSVMAAGLFLIPALRSGTRGCSQARRGASS